MLNAETWHRGVQPGREFSQLKIEKSTQLVLTNIHVIKWKLVDLKMHFESIIQSKLLFKRINSPRDYFINVILLHSVILKKSELLRYCTLGNSDYICKCWFV